MKSLKLFRTFNEGVQNFRRDKWLTMATVMVMSLALYLMGVFLFSGYGVLNIIKSIEDRINLSAEIDFAVDENKILEIKQKIEKIQEVESVNYISREDVLNDFIEKNQDDKNMMRMLEEIKDANPEGNPFYANLIITAKEFEYYSSIDEYLKKEYKDELAGTNYEKNKAAMDNFNKYLIFIKNVSLGLGSVLILISIVLTLNTIRMSLYANRKEFEIMRLVGASNLYVKLPTIFEGLLYGLTSSIITVIALIATIYGSDHFIKKVLPELNIAELYTKYFIEICLIIIALGVVLGAVSSYISIRRYLEK